MKLRNYIALAGLIIACTSTAITAGQTPWVPMETPGGRVPTPITKNVGPAQLDPPANSLGFTPQQNCMYVEGVMAISCVRGNQFDCLVFGHSGDCGE